MDNKNKIVMKQTAVEWLANEIMTKHDKSFLEFYGSEVTQAKEMEKQQIIDAHGNQQKKSGGVSNYTYILTGEKYYEETFNK